LIVIPTARCCASNICTSDDGLPHTIIDATHEYEANGQLHSRDTGRLVGSEAFRYDAIALMEQEWLPKVLGIARM
jgi:hypothetical protein